MTELTPRERAVLALVAEGLTNPEIGKRLHISAQTVKGHISSIFVKTGVKSRVTLAVQAEQILNEAPSE